MPTRKPAWFRSTRVELGTYSSGKAYAQALDAKRIRLIGNAREMLTTKGSLLIPTKPRRVNFVMVTCDDLNLEPGVSWDAFVAAAQNKGLRNSPRCMGPEARLQFGNQPAGLVYIAMEPVVLRGNALVFVLMHGGNELSLASASAPTTVAADEVWGFMKAAS